MGVGVLAKLLTFRAGHGMSVEINRVWHRIDCSVEIGLEDGDNTEAVKRKAWDTIDREIEHRITELSSMG